MMRYASGLSEALCNIVKLIRSLEAASASPLAMTFRQSALSGVSMVAANYGVARRNLGTVSLFGPSRMDYGLAIATVREAARRLSELMEGVYQ